MIISTMMHADTCELRVRLRTQTHPCYAPLHVLKLETDDGAGVTVFATREQLAAIRKAITDYLEAV